MNHLRYNWQGHILRLPIPLMISAVCSFGGFFSSTVAQEKQASETRVSDRNMEKVAARIYRDALKFYDERAYWKAAREFIILLDYYPSFSQADGVLCNLGECLYSMDMFKSSHKMFRFLVTKFPQSEYVAQGLHGLQRIQYQAENYPESIKVYNAILSTYPGSKVEDGVHYFAGMAYFHEHDYENTIAVLEKVGSRSEFYDYSLYTIGLSHLKKKASTTPCRLCVS
ncbi:hypothetical protein EDS67_14440 [candidate division KSB1 bacterium]|nr:MAG: hypothetical protein EDS67_14440 [candidate division KSB1 bacterium]MBC6950804.1 hypothetical protein [candidate division KSB1 bacterium]MCE7941030.1 hypothetical protein [Chlorobi bacterium CHB1]MDL1877604.1 hypothetical protein [Cytophagia bacterium CHB2]